MSLGRATHFKGPILGSDRAGAGLFEDFPINLMSDMDVYCWKTDFMDVIGTTNAAATVFASNWTHEFIVAGTATIAADVPTPILSLTHGVAAQGSFVRWANATAGVGGAGSRGNTISSIGASNSYLFEATATFQANTTRDDAFLGFVTNGAAPPLTAGPPSTIDTAGVANGVGFFWNNNGGGATARPTLVAWTGGALQTLVNPPTNLLQNVNGTLNFYGVRVDVGTATSNVRVRWYINRQQVFQHQMTAAFSARMTFGTQLVARGAGAQWNLSRVLLARKVDSSLVFSAPE